VQLKIISSGREQFWQWKRLNPNVIAYCCVLWQIQSR